MAETDPFTPASVAEAHRFPCNTCGADMRFDPGGAQMICDYCGAVEKIDGMGFSTRPIRELDFNAALNARLPEAELQETRVSKCPNCGALVEFDARTHAAECPFCATPVVADTGERRQIKPKGLLPFALSESDARAEMAQWLGNLWFAPNGLQEYARKGRRMSGIYVPYWTFDADTKSTYTGQRGTIYYESRQVRRDDKWVTEQVQKIRWSPASGRVARFFDDILVLASASLPKRFTDALEPWDLSALEPYRPEFLAGFRAEAYSIEIDAAYDEARGHMDRVIERDVKFDIGGDRQQIHGISTDVRDVTFKHVLLPVWMAAYKFRGKTYRFVVNGRTGRVQGERPWSAAKIAVAVILGLILAAIVGFVLAQKQ